MNSLNYLLQTNLYLILFMGFYTLVLRNETFFKQNRIFLNASIILSFTIPFINSPWFNELFITQKIRESGIITVDFNYDSVVVGVIEESNALSMADLLLWTYIGGATLFFMRFMFRIFMLRSNLKVEKGSAFSFFNKLVVDKDLPNSENIIDHEKVHIRELHSADILFIELSAIINWFNPVIYLYKKEIRHIHEFIADEEASNLMQSKSNYAMLLFSNTMGVNPSQLSNNFFNNSLLKRRIIMLNKNKSRRTGLWKYGFSAPLFALMLIFSAASVADENNMLIAEAEKLISPSIADNYIPIVTTAADKTLDKKSAPETKAKKINSSTKSTKEDFSKLLTHLQRNLRYPASARQEKITGYEVVYFKIQNGKISNIKIAKGLQNDINNEVLRTFDLFKETIEAEDNDYALAIAFHLTGIENNSLTLPSTGKNYFIGSVSVTGYLSSQKVETSGTKHVASQEVIKDFASVDVIPEFPGGMKGWGEYLQSALKYPEEAKKNKITGRVILSFIVLKNGSITDVKVLRGIGGGADEEALRVVKESPKWKPGKLKGEPVNVPYTMPIFFQLPSAATEEKTN